MLGWLDRRVLNKILPTVLFAILEPKNQDIVLSYIAQECRATDFEASRL